jgi:hypothetical protein
MITRLFHNYFSSKHHQIIAQLNFLRKNNQIIIDYDVSNKIIKYATHKNKNMCKNNKVCRIGAFITQLIH